MKYFTDTISVILAEKLKEKGMPIRYANRLVNACPNSRRRVDVVDKVLVCPTFAEVFDWIIENGIYLDVTMQDKYDAILIGRDWCISMPSQADWHRAAITAIEKALGVIKPREEDRI